jgi:hypothetical protein
MELEDKQLSLPPQTEFQELSLFEEFCNMFPIFAKVQTGLERDFKVVTAVTREHGRVLDLDMLSPENNDDEDEAHENYWVVNDEAMKMLFQNGGSSTPFEFLTKFLTDPLTLFRKPTKVIYKPSKTYENIKVNLEHMEDNGDFDKFDEYAMEMAGKYREKKDFDIVAAVKIRQAQCALYRNHLQAATRFAREAHDLAGRTQFPPLFNAQAFLVMSSVARYRKKLGETKRNLDLAQQCFESGYSIEDFAHFHEAHGSYLDKFLGISSKPDQQVKELALTSFKKMGEIGSQDSKQDVIDKNRFYALLKSARIFLDSNSSFGRKHRTVTKDSIHQAAECIRVIKRDLLDTIPRGSKIQFQLVESDLYYRQGRLDDARTLLLKSFNEAKEFGYETEWPKITEVYCNILSSVNKENASFLF